MSKLLGRYGYRVQKSAFEMYLTNNSYKCLCNEIEEIANDEDLVRIYKLHSSSLIRIWGDVPLAEDEDYFLF